MITMPDPGPHDRIRSARTQLRFGYIFLGLGVAYLVIQAFAGSRRVGWFRYQDLVFGIVWCGLGAMRIATSIRTRRAAEREQSANP